MYQRSKSVVWQGCRNRGTGSGQRQGLHKNRWLHGVPMMHGMLGHHKSVFLVPSGSMGILLKSKLP
jgi:hypothetical protein